MDLLTISEARKIEEPIIYGLADSVGSIFYVGKTASAKTRFKTHREANSKNKRLNERVKALGSHLRVVVLDLSPEDINASERARIAQYQDQVVNLIGADSWVWSAHCDTPWAAGSGVHCPSVYLSLGISSKEARKRVKAVRDGMKPHERCSYETRLFFSLHDEDKRKLNRWYEATREKMIACLESVYGVDGLGFCPEKNRA